MGHASRASLWGAAALAATGLMSCNTIGFGFVSIYPTYDWVDGCKAVRVSGHGFADDASATIGGNPVEALSYPDGELDVGYFFEGVVPAATAAGWADVEVKSGSDSGSLKEGFMYLACPASPYPETLSPDAGIVAGDTLTLQGCGLDASAIKARFTNVADPTVTADADLTSACRTATLTLAAPSLADGDYAVELIDVNGATVWPPVCDTADTSTPCTAPFTVTYGGAQ